MKSWAFATVTIRFKGYNITQNPSPPKAPKPCWKTFCGKTEVNPSRWIHRSELMAAQLLRPILHQHDNRVYAIRRYPIKFVSRWIYNSSKITDIIAPTATNAKPRLKILELGVNKNKLDTTKNNKLKPNNTLRPPILPLEGALWKFTILSNTTGSFLLV